MIVLMIFLILVVNIFLNYSVNLVFRNWNSNNICTKKSNKYDLQKQKRTMTHLNLLQVDINCYKTINQLDKYIHI